MIEGNNLAERLARLSPAKRALLEKKLRESAGNSSALLTIPRRAKLEHDPLSFAQQRLWFLDRLEPQSSAYNESSALRLDGPLNIDALRGAINAIVERHEVLRTTYDLTSSGEPIQRVCAATDIEFRVLDISEVAESQRDDEVERIATEVRGRPFDLRKDLPLRVALIKLSSCSHVLVEVRHHIASDGWSSGVFTRELAALYNSFNQDRRNTLPDLPIQYADYAVWQRETLRGEVLKREIDYWEAQLQNLPTLGLPTDRPRGSLSSDRGERKLFRLPQILFDKLRSLGNREGATLFMTLLAAFQVLLYRYTGQDDVAVGSPIAGRTRPETEGLIGLFVNMMVLRAKLSGDLTFRELLARAREIALQAYEHQDLPFEKLVEELNPGRQQNQTPLFQIAFALQNVPRHPLALDGLTATPLELKSITAKFDIFAAFVERERELTLRIEYRAELFDGTTIERIAAHFQQLLESVIADPDQKISSLLLLTYAERHQLLVEWNNTRADYPKDKCIHELFEAQAEKTPDVDAVVFEAQRLTYRELNHEANQIAWHLRKAGFGANALVGICMERSSKMVAGLIGILKAGGAYVPLDPSYPKERLGFMLDDTQAGIVLTDKVSRKSLPLTSARVICLDEDREEIESEAGNNPDSISTADGLAYVIYTSGSTGMPKGVEVRHRGVVRLLFGVDYAQLDRAQTLLQLASISFDAATFEVWGALLHGGRCILFPGNMSNGKELGEVLKKHQITTLWLTAALFNIVINEEPQALSDVKQLLIGGEVLSLPHVRKGLAQLPNTLIINGYGPTESTTFACCYRIPRQLDDNLPSIPIGKPIANTEIYILDSHLNPVPIGVAGELHIGGDGLARGYLNRPDLTTEKFIPNPFGNDPQAKLYRSGDLARYLPDGNIEFLGRIDDQVKIRGYRIELGEIEAVLGQHRSVREAVVLVREDSPGDKRLVAYGVSAPGAVPTASELRSFLQQKLPDYMVPSAFVFLNELPLTPNGKVDRKALPVPDQSRPELNEGYVGPRSVTEQRLAQIWSEVLKVERVGVHDNFFHLGGHSLLAIRLISLISKEFEREVALRSFFESPTIEGVAKYLEAGDEERDAIDASGNHKWLCLFKLKNGDNKSPVYVFPGGFGGENEALALAQIAHFVGPEYPFFGLRAKSSQGNQRAHQSVEEMARDFLKEIRSIQPKGPYHLLGHCLGGVIAYEVACQLQDQGEEVGLLGFLDTSRPTKALYYRYLGRRVIEKLIPNWQFYYRERASYHMQTLRGLDWRGKIGYIARRSETLKEVFDLKTTQAAADSRPTPSLREFRDNQASHISTLLRYRPRQYRGRVFSLVAGEKLKRKKDGTLGWGKHVTGEVQVCSGSGNHDSFIRDHTKSVGVLVRNWLEMTERKDQATT